MKTQITNIIKLLLLSLVLNAGFSASSFAAQASRGIQYKTVKIDGLDIFYREAGNPKNPTILLLHGFSTSSHMFRDLIPALSDNYHLVAPDYPGFGYSSMPKVSEFDYSFDNLAKVMDKFIGKVGLKKYSIYLMDYGAPVGFRIATKHPERVEALIIQNGNAYVEGIDNNFWEPIQAYWKDRKAVNQGLIIPGGQTSRKLISSRI